jgi:arsenate reductase
MARPVRERRDDIGWDDGPRQGLGPRPDVARAGGNIMTVTVYHDPDSATSRDVLALIRNSGEVPEIIEYLRTPPSRETLVDLLRRMDIPAYELLRQGEPSHDELGLDDPRWDDDALIDLMLRHPTLMNRPIVVSPLGVRLCRPSETVLNILPAPQAGAFRKENGAPVIDDQGRRVDRTALD